MLDRPMTPSEWEAYCDRLALATERKNARARRRFVDEAKQAHGFALRVRWPRRLNGSEYTRAVVGPLPVVIRHL